MKGPFKEEPESDESLAMVAAFQPGDTVLHYRMTELIGEGGMGEVYKAWDTKLGRPVAIKVLPLRMGRDPLAPKRLLREARAASALNHPNIVTIHAIEESGDSCFISMEYVEGESLAKRISTRPLNLKELVAMGAQVADALAAAHEAGLIHRDVKPENILINKSGQVKLLDFGLAKRGTEDSASIAGLTQSGTISGTVGYMSPEQTHGQTLDSRTDIFSLGCVLYQASTGQLPFAGESVLDIMNAINSVDPPLPGTIQTKLPQEFDLIISRCMAKDKEARYFSAREIAEALRKMPVTRVHPPNPTNRVQKRVERKSPLVAVLVMITIALLLFYFIRKPESVPAAAALKAEKPAQVLPLEPKKVEQAPVQEIVPEKKEEITSPQDPGNTSRPDAVVAFPPDANVARPGLRNEGPPPHPPFFPPRPGSIVLIGTTWHMQMDGGDVYFHFTPHGTVYLKADFLKEGSTICGRWHQNPSSITVDVCNGSKWEGVRERDRIRWRITGTDGMVEDDVYSEQSESAVDW
jgi:serine/threonine protein kinase